MIPESLRSVVDRHGDRLAIIDGDQRITYGEFFERVQSVREWLRNVLGPQPGIIAVSLDNSWLFAAYFFAISELGGASMCCNPQWRAAELRPLARRLGFRAAVVDPRWTAEWNQILDLIPGGLLFPADKMPAGNPAAGASSPPRATADGLNAPAAYLSTSGSLGLPRLVPRSHRNLIAVAENVALALGTGPGWRFLSVVPFYYSNGFHNSMLVPLLSGATAVMMPKFSTGACEELVRHEQVNTLIGSPFLYGSLLDGVRNPASLSSMQRCFSAGGRMPSGVIERWQARFGVPIRQLYGMTETGVIALESSEPAPGSSAGACVGQPIHGVEVAVFGTDGLKAAPGEIGELAVRSAAVMSGYAGEGESDSVCFHDGFFHTGDLGFLDSGGVLHLTGRIGRVMNIAGIKVDPVEVERAVEMLAGVASCHVDAVPNGAGGEVIRARVVPREGFQVTRREVIEQCRRHIADYKFPRVIEFLENSPITIAGKTSRQAAPGDSRT